MKKVLIALRRLVIPAYAFGIPLLFVSDAPQWLVVGYVLVMTTIIFSYDYLVEWLSNNPQ